MARRPLATILLLASLLPLAHGQGWTRFHFDEEVPLALDVERVALLAAADDAAAFAGPAVEAGLPGWSFVQVPAAARDDAGVQAFVSDLARAGIYASPVFRGDDGGPVFLAPRLLVAFRPEVPEEQREALVVTLTAAAILERDWAGTRDQYLLESPYLDGFAVLGSANALARRHEVLFAEPDFAFTGRGAIIPSDPSFGSSWGLHNTGQGGGLVDADMDAPEAWDVTQGSPSIQVVVIDTGVQLDHPDLNLGPGTDWTGQGSGGAPFNACDNHGTPVAGCISEIIDNGLGTCGVAPLCKSASARAFVSNLTCDGSWNSFASYTVNALGWAQTIGARVTNNSNFYGFTSSAIASQYAATRAAGIVHFASAGNTSSSSVTYPASLSTVNALSAMDRNGTKASFSNFGNKIAFCAPGESILTTDRTGAAGWDPGDYVSAFGTSFASPYAAGVAALVLTVDPSLNAVEVECRLRMTVDDRGAPGFDTFFGWGVVNAHRAVTSPAAARLYGSATNPANSLSVQGGPQVGTTYSVLVDNPVGTQGSPSFTAVAVATRPDPNFPTGSAVPGWGMSPPGAAGELLVSLLPGELIGIVTGGVWTGFPAQVDLVFPTDPGLIGRCFYAQGVLLDPAVTFGVRFGLTRAAELLVGP